MLAVPRCLEWGIPGATRQAVLKLDPYQEGIARRNLNGSTLTNQHAYHWSESGSHACLICGASDSLHHRYWECPHSSALRAKLDPGSMDLVPSLPRVCSVRSWFLFSPLVEPWWQYLLSLPDLFPPLLFDKCHSSLVLLCTNKDNLPCWHKFKSITFYMFCGFVVSLKLLPFHGLQGEIIVVSLECNCDQSKLCRQTATCGRVGQLPVFLN